MDHPPQPDLTTEEIDAGYATRDLARLNGELVCIGIQLPGWRMRQRLLTQFLQDKELSGFVYFCLVNDSFSFPQAEHLLDTLAPESLSELERLCAQAVIGVDNQKKMWAGAQGLLRSILGASGFGPSTPPSPPATPPETSPAGAGSASGSSVTSSSPTASDTSSPSSNPPASPSATATPSPTPATAA